MEQAPKSYYISKKCIELIRHGFTPLRMFDSLRKKGFFHLAGRDEARKVCNPRLTKTIALACNHRILFWDEEQEDDVNWSSYRKLEGRGRLFILWRKKELWKGEKYLVEVQKARLGDRILVIELSKEDSGLKWWQKVNWICFCLVLAQGFPNGMPFSKPVLIAVLASILCLLRSSKFSTFKWSFFDFPGASFSFFSYTFHDWMRSAFAYRQAFFCAFQTLRD